LINKALFAIAAAAAVAAASGVCIVALAFTLYALMREVVGPAGAAASVAGAAALLIVIVAAGLAIKVGTKKRVPGLGERVAGVAKQRPLAAGAVALAAAIFAARNPKMLIPVVLAFLEPKAGRKT